MLRIVAITLIQGMLPAIFGLVFLWIKSDVTLIAPWPMLMLFIFFANLLIVAAGWKYLGVTRSDMADSPSSGSAGESTAGCNRDGPDLR